MILHVQIIIVLSVGQIINACTLSLKQNKNIIFHKHSSHPCPSLPLSSYFYLSYHFYISHLEHLDFDTGVGHIT